MTQDDNMDETEWHRMTQDMSDDINNTRYDDIKMALDILLQ